VRGVSRGRGWPFLRLGLIAVGDLRPGTAPVTLIGQGDQASGFQLVQHAPDPLRFLVVGRSGQRARRPQDVPGKTGDDLQVHPMPLVLAGLEGPVRGDPVDRDQGAVEDHIDLTCLLRIPNRSAELRGAGRKQVHGLVHVPPHRGPADPEPAATSVNVSPFFR
jgi:hypothetical protein